MTDESFAPDDDASSSDAVEVDESSSKENQSISVSKDVNEGKFQKVKGTIRLLPYYESLKKETEESLEKLISNLMISIVTHDLQVGFSVYSKGLRQYMILYGRKFTKEQQLKLIRLMYDVITMEQIPFNVLNDALELYMALIKKPDLLTRDDLTVKWRPLYDTLLRAVFKRKYSMSLSAATKLENSIKAAVRMSNVYFEEGTIDEVLEEFKQYLCPTSVDMIYGLEMLRNFTPFLDITAEEKINKFIDELFLIFDSWNNSPSWEGQMINYFMSAAWNMPGSYDWTPRLPTIYARMIKNFQLPTHFKNCFASSSSKIDFIPGCFARLIIASLGNNPEAMKYLENTLEALETYYNPSNIGKWTAPLASFLSELVQQFSFRVKKERYSNREKRWWYRIAPEKEITDTDIDQFVNMISRLVLEFYLEPSLFVFTLVNLSMLRPKKIVPAVMEKYSDMVETVIEPSKYLVALRWVGSVRMPLLGCRKKTHNFDGRSYVMPFLMSLLPAIDLNDLFKTSCSLGIIILYFNLILIVDCSPLAGTIEDEEEREICSSTSCMEDFVLQLTDRIFTFIENRSLENTRMGDHSTNSPVHKEDITLTELFWSAFNRLASQCSTPICKSLVDKVTRFALTNTLEVEVSGRIFSGICQAISCIRPDLMLPKILPQLCQSIKSHVSDEIVDEEELDKTFLFHLQLLSHVLETSGVELLKYREILDETIDAILRLNGKKAYNFTSSILRHLFQSLGHIYPNETKTVEEDIDDPNYLAIKDWCRLDDNKNVHPNWHMPTEEEVLWIREVFVRTFKLLTNDLDTAAKAKNEHLNKTIPKRIQILLAMYEGFVLYLPFWDNDPMTLPDTKVDLSSDTFNFDLPTVDSTLDGVQISRKYFEFYGKIFKYLNEFKNDDVEAYVLLTKGYYSLMFPNVVPSKRVVLMAGRELNKLIPLHPKLKYTRSRILIQAYECHTKRVSSSITTSWTHSHVEIMAKLSELAVNRYAKVRINAQSRFLRVQEAFGCIVARTVSQFFYDPLKNGVPHDIYKGTLYTIGGGRLPIILNNSWYHIKRLWLSLVETPFSEKNSIITIMEKLKNLLSQTFIYTPLNQAIPGHIKNAAKMIPKDDAVLSNAVPIDQSENIAIYSSLVNRLIEEGSNPNNHWRKQMMCISMLSVIVSDKMEIPLQEKLVKYYFDCLLSCSIDIRKCAMWALINLLSNYKRCVQAETLETKQYFGDNARSILLYDVDSRHRHPRYNGHPIYVHKTSLGYFSMPKKIKVKLPVIDFSDVTTGQSASIQAVLKVTKQYMENEDYIRALMAFWILEEKDKRRPKMVKLIARNNGPDALKLLLRYASEVGADKDQWKQRCAADILGGTLTGMKLWGDDLVEAFWNEHLKELLDKCLTAATQETMMHWCSTLTSPTQVFEIDAHFGGILNDIEQTNRDPSKMWFLIEFLKERLCRSLERSQTTSVDAFKDISFFCSAISIGSWRGGQINFDTLSLMKKHFFETPIPYRNVRLSLGRLISGVFALDLIHPIDDVQLCPKAEPFIEFLLESLKPVNVEMRPDEEDNKVLFLKFKTGLEFLYSMVWLLDTTFPSMVYQFIPLLAKFESYEADPEISNLATATLSGMSKAVCTFANVDPLLTILERCSKDPSWKRRLCVLEFLKVMVVINSNTLSSRKEWAQRVIDLVLFLLQDRKIEVRELASSIFCGFLHCCLVPEPLVLLNKLKKESARVHQLKKAKKLKSQEEIDSAHATILGLCAFVDTHPYDVPLFLPEILIILTTHMHDPQPIPGTIRKCLSNFRRTHHDNWSTHKAMFSEDQLCILTDIFVSPCYYA